KPDETIVRVPAVQEQDAYCPGADPVRCQAAVPGAGVHEHCRAHVHGPVWRVHSL
ncbi:hypothetical protein SEUCBS139899_010201, partial [Sporothrix eucalyptigena]